MLVELQFQVRDIPGFRLGWSAGRQIVRSRKKYTSAKKNPFAALAFRKKPAGVNAALVRYWCWPLAWAVTKNNNKRNDDLMTELKIL